MSCSSDSLICATDVEKGVVKRTLQHALGHAKGCDDFVYSTNYKVLISCGTERNVVVWNAYTSKPIANLSGHQVSCLKANPKLCMSALALQASIKEVHLAENLNQVGS